MQTLRVSADRRHIEQADGSRFYFLGDTAWERFHKRNREEAAWYLRTRAEQGYNMIQAVVLAELDGLGTANAYGRFPLKKTDGVFDLTGVVFFLGVAFLFCYLTLQTLEKRRWSD